MSAFPLKVHSGSVEFRFALVIVLSPISDRTALLSFSLTEIANSNFPLSLFDNFPAIVIRLFCFLYLMFSVVAKKLSMIHSNF